MKRLIEHFAYGLKLLPILIEHFKFYPSIRKIGFEICFPKHVKSLGRRYYVLSTYILGLESMI